MATLLDASFAHAAVTSTGNLDPSDPTTWTESSTTYIGRSVDGKLNVDGGSVISSNYSYLGYDSGATGTADLTEVGSKWNVGRLFVGQSGTGIVNLENGATLNSAWVILGSEIGSDGAVTVTDAGSQWINGIVTVGFLGVGTLTIQDGAYVHNFQSIVGALDGASGTVVVTGAGSRWATDNNLDIGNAGVGTLNIQQGAVVSSASGSLNSPTGLVSSATVEGAGSAWNVGFSLNLGGSGTSVLRIHDGGTVTAGLDTRVGSGPNVTGQIHFDNGVLNTGGLLAGVNQLQGVGTIHTRGLVSDIDLSFDGSHGLTQSLLFNALPGQNVAIDLDLSGESNGSLGAGFRTNGSLTIADGVAIQSDDGYLGYGADAHGQATVTGAGSKWDSDHLYVGVYGSGTLTIREGAAITNTFADLGLQAGSSGGMIVDGAGSTWNIDSSLSVGASGSGNLTIQNGASVNSTSTRIGGSGSSYGEATLTGAESTWKNSGFTFSVAGRLHVLDGAALTSINGNIGEGALSNGEASVVGVGSVWKDTGGIVLGNAGSGMLTIADGGLVEVGSAEAARNVTFASRSFTSHGVLNLEDGGTLRLHGGRMTLGNGSASFNFNGGRLEGVGTYSVGDSLTQHGGVLAPGNSAGVTLINGDYDLQAGALEIELEGNGGVAGTDFDQLVVTSDVSLGVSGVLNVLLGYAAQVGDSFLIVKNTGANSISGAFANEATLVANFGGSQYDFSIDYAAGDGNDIALTVASVTAIPEPATLALLMLTAPLGFAGRR